jgi:predicted nucleic acid-binding Zn ribbon protein
MARRRAALKRLIPISDVFSRGVFGERGETLLTLYHLRKNWGSIVGESLASKSVPRRVQGGVLMIATENPAWAQTLSLMKDEVLAAIAGYTGREFSDLRFVTEASSDQPGRIRS